MNLDSELLLGLNTTVISMGIVFVVLIALAFIIVIQSRILRILTRQPQAMGEASQIGSQTAAQAASQSAVPTSKKGLTKGEAKLIGLEDEEHVAVIMAAVSNASNIPLSSLKIRSIKRVDNTWDVTTKQEKVNQRL